MELAELLDKRAQEKIRKRIASDEFVSLSADVKFNVVFEVVRAKSPRASVTPWNTSDGLRIAKVTRTAKGVTLTFDQKSASEFGDFVIGKLEGLYVEFKDHLSNR